jgi:hypothetical protein
MALLARKASVLRGERALRLMQSGIRLREP